jgi:hypothetical protein
MSPLKVGRAIKSLRRWLLLSRLPAGIGGEMAEWFKAHAWKA